MAGVAVYEVVLTAVGFIGDDHDVAPLGQDRVGVPFLIGEELLDGGEHHPARFHRQFAAQVGPACGLAGGLAEQVLATGEDAEQLVVQVVAVGEDDDGRVFHGRFADDSPGVERHGQAFSRSLRVPHHSDAPVARLSPRPPLRVGGVLHFGGPQGLLHRRPHRVELMVSGHFLNRLLVLQPFENNKVAYQGQKPPPLQHAVDEGVLLEGACGSVFGFVDGAPLFEPFPPGGEGAHPSFQPVGHDQCFVHRE